MRINLRTKVSIAIFTASVLWWGNAAALEPAKLGAAETVAGGELVLTEERCTFNGLGSGYALMLKNTRAVGPTRGTTIGRGCAMLDALPSELGMMMVQWGASPVRGAETYRIDDFSWTEKGRRIVAPPLATKTTTRTAMPPQINEYDELNEKCRGGSGDSPTTAMYCKRRDAMYSEIKKLGWCWGPDDVAGSDKNWMRCQSKNAELLQDKPNGGPDAPTKVDRQLALCLSAKAKAGNYSSQDGGKSAGVLLLDKCTDEFLDWNSVCTTSGGTKNGCLQKGLILAQFAIKSSNR